jgi:hypothetical protein
MIEVGESVIPMDMTEASISYNVKQLLPHKDGSVFFVVYTHPYQVFLGHYTHIQLIGFAPVFFVPKDNLPNDWAWDVVMYSSTTSEAIARMHNRPTT